MGEHRQVAPSDPEEFGEWILDRRMAEDWSQEELANKLGVTRADVKQWEDGKSLPTGQDTLDAIRRFFGAGPSPSSRDEPIRPFALWLREARKRMDLTQEELAKKAGLSYITISLIETGRTQSPHRATVEALRKALGEPLTSELEADLRTEQEVGEGLGVYYGPFPVEAWEEHAESVACVYVVYDQLQRPVRIGSTGNLTQCLREYKGNYWWFREPTASTFAYVEIDREETREQVEKIMIKLVGSQAMFNA